MGYAKTERQLLDGNILVMDGGTGTELERRGVMMNEEAWCGPATLNNVNILEAIHRDYITAGADIITANTYASSRLMLEPAGFADRFSEINRTAVKAAHRARQASGRDDVLIAGSLSHMTPIRKGTSKTDIDLAISKAKMADAFSELADLLCEEGCDLILLEMMYDPERIALAINAAAQTGLPIWAGFSARSGTDGSILSFVQDEEIPFADVVQVLNDFDVAAAGVMHTPSNIVGGALAQLREAYSGPLTAYPDSGYFKMPHWQFEDVISPQDFLGFARQWVEMGVQVVGGCCGLTPAHIAALKPLKEQQ